MPIKSLSLLAIAAAASLSLAVPGALTAPTATAATSSCTAPPVQPEVRYAFQNNQFYFAMTDRFSNGDTSNDQGAYPGSTDVSKTGYDPTNKYFYHGGDFLGLMNKLDYIKGTGATAIWINPVMKNMTIWTPEVGGQTSDLPFSPQFQAAYHGYFVLDFLNVDPHWGTDAAFEQLVNAVHAHGMKLYLDIENDITADVIHSSQDTNTYIPKSVVPYKDAYGNPFDDRDYIGTGMFPPLDPNVSFPYKPVIPAGEENVKNPAWLNNPIYYHNRGDWYSPVIQDGAEDETYGDFLGLDDLFTEQPAVVQGEIDIYKHWIDLGVDGFRIDSMKHVNLEFWQQFIPSVVDYAKSKGKPDFFTFGEVYSTDPTFTSKFTTHGKAQSVLDFPFQDAARRFASEGQAPSNTIGPVFAGDDYYTDADSNAHSLATFLGNHDMGRIGGFIASDNPTASDSEMLHRDQLAHALMYFARGVPVVYYGDEQGFEGGGYEDGRQDMFASQTLAYQLQHQIGTTRTPAQDNFRPDHPLYQALAALAQVRQANQALRTGAQIERYSSGQAGIYAFSRIDDAQKIEYVVALNNATTAQTATFPTSSPATQFDTVYPAQPTVESVVTNSSGHMTVNVPPLSAVVYKASKAIPASATAPAVTVTSPTPVSTVTGRFEIDAQISTPQFAEVTFAVSTNGGCYVPIGTSDHATYRIFYHASKVPAGTKLQIVATVNDLNRHTRTSSPVSVVVG